MKFKRFFGAIGCNDDSYKHFLPLKLGTFFTCSLNLIFSFLYALLNANGNNVLLMLLIGCKKLDRNLQLDCIIPMFE